MIKVEVAAHSLSPQGDELFSVLATFPRIILAEVNTHRMLSKNTSSSRAIPFPIMVKSVRENPFIPIAWQKYHPGMQGTEYLSKTDKFNLMEFTQVMSDTLNSMLNKESKDYIKLKKRLDEKIAIITNYLHPYVAETKTLDDWWLFARDKAVEAASILYVFDVTKQLCNRLLEPFMWTTMLITGSKEGWDNFFSLRLPEYHFSKKVYKSKKDAIKDGIFDYKDFSWLYANKGQAEIHMMALAEAIYDAMNESAPIQLQAGEWHIPFLDKIDLYKVAELLPKGNLMPNPETTGGILTGNKIFITPEYSINESFTGANGQVYQMFDFDIKEWFNTTLIKISTALGARTSYTVVGDEKEIDYTKMIELHDRLINQKPLHASPMEHCARAMSDEEYFGNIKGEYPLIVDTTDGIVNCELYPQSYNKDIYQEMYGWCRNYRGFIQYRHILETQNK